ncbi:uncharacterized protein LOC118735102 [Rhagoletis pomonella]|uniref:uncharacterized protein LOC118735102 n=1 Tax=Rhagoletis pomonella TaxID=28610 RepID=UPI001785B12B|nr:uncharacterized protein LOC118735102 [Rhagoletis pomonella]
MASLNKRAAAVTAINRVTTRILADGYSGDGFAIAQDQATVQSLFDRFAVAHDGLIIDAKKEELDAHLDLWDQMEDLYNKAMAKVHRLQATISSTIRNPPSNADDNDSIGLPNPMAMNLKVERLSVPKFDGRLRNWLAFKDAFDTLVHSQEFPEAYKLGKLREAVQGDAVALVGGMYSGGYEEVWKALKDRYDSPRQLADIHVAQFIGLDPITAESTSALLSVVDTVRESLRALAVMKIPVDQWYALAVPIVVSKLPARTQQAWGMSRTTQDIPRLDDLLAFVEKRAHSLTADVLRWPMKSSNLGNRGSPSIQRTSTPGGHTTHASRLVKTNLAATTPGNCEYCNTYSHRIGRCPQLLALPVQDQGCRLDLNRSNWIHF